MMSSSDPTTNSRGLAQLIARRQPDLATLAATNIEPESAQHIPLEQRRTIITVEQQSCRWPIGDPQLSSFYLCGARTDGQHSYCDRHHKMAFAPIPKARRVA